MRLFRFGPVGYEKPGALDASGQLRDLSSLLDDITPDLLVPQRLLALRDIDLETLPVVPTGARMGPPVAAVRQFIAIGLNYRKHALEAGMDIPMEPVVFHKSIGSLAGPDDDVVLPFDSQATDWEIELGFVIGSRVHQIGEADAYAAIAGYFLANDISERDWQIKRNGQWGKGKSFDGFGPIGPWLVTADELGDPQKIDLELKVNGEVMQRSNTADMIFSVATIVSYLSQFMTLYPGDIVITGTPEGVGLGRKPAPVFLRRGDVMTLSGGILGTQRQRVV